MKRVITTEYRNQTCSSESRGSKGFTIIELLIASAVFSVILLLAATAVIKIGQIYYKGIIANRTQEVSRSITDQIAQSLQFNGGQVTPIANTAGSIAGVPVTTKGFCIDDKRYSYILDRELIDGPPDPTTQSPHVFMIDGNCAGPTPAALQLDGSATPPVDARELVSEHMRLGISPMPIPNGNLYSLNIELIYGNEAVIVSKTPYACAPSNGGGQFCSVSQLSTIIEKRVQ